MEVYISICCIICAIGSTVRMINEIIKKDIEIGKLFFSFIELLAIASIFNYIF
jgi:hypothetical protein